ncbi:oligosaccharide flippase family protein [Pseudooctadecabacter jejudonensis]|uniref:Lipopolysaccharide biosynthesis protein WzxC n=1 Tax=Pseudooctadecabacter jejudonensis TaxID=1391910 RepID=A0A1Y5S0X9_9RHOB|nr:oligosaccharide flippase family protein [Pseudooctadecabacter jejudonensis]SLN27434.1 Lipopolysaccharide biosynthesis protein WzxC [Pseudooctadecabacter jejudonensis]
MIRTIQTQTFLTSLAAYGASEVAAKASRLLVVVAVARTLDVAVIGVAAAALAAGDILKALTENGIGQRIIAARTDTLEAVCITARRLFWMWCAGLFVAQLALAGALYGIGADPLLAALIALMGLEYLFMPAGLVQVALAMRAGQLKQTAALGGAQVVGANLISIVLLVLWPSAIALVIPRVLSAPIWLIAVRRLHPWTPGATAGAPLAPFLRYGWAVLGVEVVKVLRLQADKLIVGVTLGAEALGLYFMAFNAGLSLSNAFANAFSTVLFPQLARATDKAQSARSGLVLGLCCITPLVLMQAALVPVYVPMLLGDGWAGIEVYVQILCLLAIPTTLWAAAASWLRHHDRPHVEFAITSGLAAAVVLNALMLGPIGLTALVVGYATLSALLMTATALWVLRRILLPTTNKWVTP